MTELSVIFILAFIAALIAGWSGAWLARLTPGDEQDHRLKRAMRSAADTLVRRQGKHLLRALGLNVLLCGGLGFGFDVPHVIWFGGGVTLGVGVAWALSQLSTTFSLNAAAASAKVLGAVDSALVINVRAASAVAQVSVLCSLLVGAIALLIHRGDAPDAHVTSSVLLAGTLCGSVLTLLFTLLCSGSLRVAAVVSRRATSASFKHPLFWVDPTNPSFVADLVGQHTSGPRTWALLGFSLALSLQLLATLFAPAGESHAAAALTTVLVVSASTATASAVVHLALRAPEGLRSWKTMLGYSLIAGAALAIFSSSGAAYWLLGETQRSTAQQCSIVGVLLGLAVALVAERGRRHRGLDDAETHRRPVLELLFSADSAFVGAAGSLGLVMLSIVVAQYLTPGVGLHATDAFYVACGLLGLLPYLLTQALLGPNLEATSSLCALRFERNHTEPTTNLNALYAVAQDVSFNGQLFLATTTAVLALASYLAAESAASPTPAGGASGAVAALGALGSLVLTLSVFTHQAHATASVGVAEVTRHRRSDPPNPSPGYSQYVEQTSERAFRRITVKCVSLIVGLMAFIGLLRGLSPETVAASRATFLAFLSTSGSAAAYFALGLGFHLGTSRGSRRALAAGIDGSSDVSTGTTLGFAECVSGVLLPAILALVQLTSALTICVRVLTW